MDEPKVTLGKDTKVQVPATLASESAKIAASLEPIRSSLELDDDRYPSGRRRVKRGKNSNAPDKRGRTGKAKGGRPRGSSIKDPVDHKNLLESNLAKKIAERVNAAVPSESIERSSIIEANETLLTPFDPTKPVTTQERTLATVEKIPALSTDLASWQDRLSVEKIKSIDRICFLRDHAYSESVQLRAAQDLLDRSGSDMRKNNKPLTAIIYAEKSTDDLLADLERLNALEAEVVPQKTDAAAAGGAEGAAG